MVGKKQEIQLGDYWSSFSRDFNSLDWGGGFGYGEIEDKGKKICFSVVSIFNKCW